MKVFPRGTAQEFQHEVAAILGLPLESSSLELRAALKTKGSHYLAWYDTRMRAISDASVEAIASASTSH